MSYDANTREYIYYISYFSCNIARVKQPREQPRSDSRGWNKSSRGSRGPIELLEEIATGDLCCRRIRHYSNNVLTFSIFAQRPRDANILMAPFHSLAR